MQTTILFISKVKILKQKIEWRYKKKNKQTKYSEA